MTTSAYMLAIATSLVVLFVIVRMLLKGRLRERHAVLWLVAGIASVIVATFPQLLEFGAEALGVEVPANLLFFVSIAVLFGVSVQYGAELTRVESRIRALAERVAILEMERDEARMDDGDSQD